MSNILNILNQLESNNSRNFKLDVLKQNKDNQLFKEVITLALNPFINFYQRKIPKYITKPVSQHYSLDSALSNLYILSNRELTGNAAIDYLSDVLSSVSEDDAKVLERVITKDLKCGVARSSVNSVWKNLIPEYPVMLCSGFSEKTIEKIKFPAIVQLKMDGMRFNAIVVDNKCEFRSRNGKELNLLGFLEQEFIDLAGGIDTVFDGELVVELNDTISDRQTGNGIVSKSIKGTLSSEEANLIHATVWDCITYDSFIQGISKTPYSVRFNRLSQLSFPQNNKIKFIEYSVVENYDAAKNIFEEYLNAGQEGIILKDLSGIWENKRVNHQIKFKGEYDCDLRVVSVESGSGKYTDMMGALVCESEDKIIKVSVGSGFSDSQRISIDSSVIGKIISVRYNARIKNKQGGESLFLPIFLNVREDKDHADTSDLIK